MLAEQQYHNKADGGLSSAFWARFKSVSCAKLITCTQCTNGYPFVFANRAGADMCDVFVVMAADPGVVSGAHHHSHQPQHGGG